MAARTSLHSAWGGPSFRHYFTARGAAAGAYREMDDEIPLDVLFADTPSSSWSAFRLSDAVSVDLPVTMAVWGSALYLSQWLVAHPETVHARSVVELGAGIGLPSLASAKLGARSIVCTELCDKALALIDETAARNQVADRLRASRLDWFDVLRTRSGAPTAEVVLAADINYYTESVQPILATISATLAPGGILVLASREQRHGLLECYDALLAMPDMTLTQAVSFDGHGDGAWVYLDHADLRTSTPSSQDVTADAPIVVAEHRLWVFRRRV